MTTVFVLASDLGSTGPARQLALTLPALPRDRFRVEVGTVGAGGAAAAALQMGGISVRSLPLRNPFDARGLVALARAVREPKPDLVHAVGPAALRASYFLSEGPALVASGAAFPDRGWLGWAAARRLRRADRVVSQAVADDDRYAKCGVSAERLVRVVPAVRPAPPPPDGDAFRRSIGVPPRARMIAAAGRLDRVAGLRDAVWAFDVLKYESSDFYLVLVGDGPERPRLEDFGRALSFDDYRVRFAGYRPDLPALLSLAEAVWVTHERGGTNVALEATAAGRPVLGWRTPDLAEVVREGETGFLFARGDRIGLASKTRTLLDDRAFAARVGEEGRRVAAADFGVEAAAGQLAEAYRACLRSDALPAGARSSDN